MATSKRSGAGEKGAASTGAAAKKSTSAGTAAKGAAASGSATKSAGKTTAKSAGRGTGAAAKKSARAGSSGSGDGAANVQPKGRAPAKRGGGGGGGREGAASASGDQRRGMMREFCSNRLGGWSHDEWEGLLGDLQQSGHDVSDRSAVGMELERERLSMVLEKVPGVSGAKAKSLVSRFHRLYDLRQASPDEIASAGKLPRPLAERIAEAIR